MEVRFLRTGHRCRMSEKQARPGETQLQRRRNTRVLRNGNERFLAANCNLTSSYSVTRRKKGYFVRNFFSFIEKDDLRTKKSLIFSGK